MFQSTEGPRAQLLSWKEQHSHVLSYINSSSSTLVSHQRLDTEWLPRQLVPVHSNHWWSNHKNFCKSKYTCCSLSQICTVHHKNKDFTDLWKISHVVFYLFQGLEVINKESFRCKAQTLCGLLVGWGVEESCQFYQLWPSIIGTAVSIVKSSFLPCKQPSSQTMGTYLQYPSAICWKDFHETGRASAKHCKYLFSGLVAQLSRYANLIALLLPTYSPATHFSSLPECHLSSPINTPLWF